MRLLKQWLPVVLWAGLILASANDELSAQQTGGWLQRLFGEVPYALHVGIRKLAHVIVYAVLAALAWRADRRWWPALVIASVVASIDETLQGRTLTRTGSPWDVLLDVLAAALTVLVLRRISASSLRLPPRAQGRGGGSPVKSQSRKVSKSQR